MTSSDSPHRDAINQRLIELEHELRELRVQWSNTATEAYQSALGQWQSAAADLSLLLAQESSSAPRDDDVSAAEETHPAPRRYPHWA
ncbi:hypothetical protein BHE97_16915 [Aeromicrobium sp. PE09-221]|uniref:hypothetical protein n=1 Tax=Aeromicrobium sp. PE09-221 TaxID=1898043 RepID=UPI000B3E9C15|nr:hypothetical protein [Aeromicrobium sp. PE09-221]OUZ07488.1 hypothetical protein BHE97_16915 [Aeromicrobium sp. PE09-221]